MLDIEFLYFNFIRCFDNPIDYPASSILVRVVVMVSSCVSHLPKIEVSDVV